MPRNTQWDPNKMVQSNFINRSLHYPNVVGFSLCKNKDIIAESIELGHIFQRLYPPSL